MTPEARIWVVTLLLGLGTFLIRWSFIGVIGRRELPVWARRLLAYVPVAVIPGLAAPLVIWPAGTGGQTDPARLLAALVALAIGAWTRSMLGAIAGGMGSLYLALWAFG